MKETPYSVLLFARRFFFGTLLSRFGGFFRDVTMAFCFGSTPEVASFMVAYRLANLFRRLLGEGNAQAGFIPLFEQIKTQSLQSAFAFYREASRCVGLLVILVVLCLEGLLYGALPFLSKDWQQIGTLCMAMVPGLFFICLFSLQAGLLQSQKKPFLVGLAPAIFNLGWIVAALASYQRSNPMVFLAFGVTGSFGFQWLFAKIQVKREMQLEQRDLIPRLFTERSLRLFKPMMLGIVGVGAAQINSALDAIFAKIADPSGPAYLWYAIRIEQLPLALFGIAFSSALLPSLSRAISEDSMETYQRLLKGAVQHTLTLMVPCTFGLLVLGTSGLNLLYGHGGFTPKDVMATSSCLTAYALGLIPSALVLLLAQGFYAKKSYKPPLLASLSAVAVNLFLNAFFVFGLGWGAISIALATSASSWINCLILYKFLQNRGFSVGGFLARVVGASAIAAGICFFTQTLWGDLLVRETGFQLLQFASGAGIYLGAIVTLFRIFKVKELFELFALRAKL